MIENYFEAMSPQSVYWAGFLAADGYFSNTGKTKKSIYLSMAEKDLEHLEQYKKDLGINNEITFQIKDDKYIQYRLFANSISNRKYLNDFYNLTNKKSLTLKPPLNLSDDLTDFFIKGYIDGDGSIFITKRKNDTQGALTISIIGTLEMLLFVKNRFEKILCKKITTPKQKRKNNKNTYVLTISSLNARIIFEKYYNLKCNCLNRKWSEENYNHCLSFSKNKKIKRISKCINIYKKVYLYTKTNDEKYYPFNKKDNNRFKRTKNSENYKLFVDLVDRGVVDIEDQQSENQ